MCILFEFKPRLGDSNLYRMVMSCSVCFSFWWEAVRALFKTNKLVHGGSNGNRSRKREGGVESRK